MSGAVERALGDAVGVAGLVLDVRGWARALGESFSQVVLRPGLLIPLCAALDGDAEDVVHGSLGCAVEHEPADVGVALGRLDGGVDDAVGEGWQVAATEAVLGLGD